MDSCKHVEIPSGGLCLIDQSMVDGVESEFEAVGDAEFIENIVQVIFHCLFADEEFLADFLVSVALGDKLHDFLFSIAQKGLFAAWPAVG